MSELFDEAEKSHHRLLSEAGGSKAVELLAEEVVLCQLERFLFSMQEQTDSDSSDGRITARMRSTDSAHKRLLAALKAYATEVASQS